MDDSEFIRRIQQRIQEGAATAVDVELDHRNPRAFEVELSRPIPQIIMGADVLKYPGLARMFIQYAVLCLRERRKVEDLEFRAFLRRN
jgi:hypothetical protein